MNGQRVIAVALLVASLFVLGTLSASLDATVTSTPNDAIDVDKESLPFVGDGASQIADSYEAGSGDAPERNVGSAGEGSSSGGGGEPPGDAGSNDPADDQSQSASGQAGDSAEGASGKEGQQGSQGAGQKQGGQGSGLTDSLWDLLGRLLIVLLTILALLALLAAAVFVARRREAILARLRAFAERHGLLPADDRATDVAADGEAAASNVVERAWGVMVQASGAAPPPSDTPRECARAVMATGADREPVEALTDMYERVRYGDGSITPDDASRALGHLREVAPDADGKLADGGNVPNEAVDGFPERRDGQLASDGGEDRS